LRFTDIETAGGAVERRLVEQVRGSHADEVETSIMLHLLPGRVTLHAAVRDDAPRLGAGGFSRVPGQGGIHSPTGTWGDPTLATADKGAAMVAAITAGVVDDIEALRRLPA
jgi:creatinine amidohydrolase